MVVIHLADAAAMGTLDANDQRLTLRSGMFGSLAFYHAKFAEENDQDEVRD
jgi:hypothetical protein